MSVYSSYYDDADVRAPAYGARGVAPSARNQTVYRKHEYASLHTHTLHIRARPSVFCCISA